MYILFLVLFSSVSILLSANVFLDLNTKTALAQNQTPTVTLEVKIDSQNSITAKDWSEDNATIIVADQVSLRWEAKNASACTGSADSNLHLFDTGSKTAGTDTNIYEPSVGTSITYTVTCMGSNDVALDSVTVTKPVSYTHLTLPTILRV